MAIGVDSTLGIVWLIVRLFVDVASVEEVNAFHLERDVFGRPAIVLGKYKDTRKLKYVACVVLLAKI